MAAEPNLVVTFRNLKAEFCVKPILSVLDVKLRLIELGPASSSLMPSDIRLLFKGKVVENENEKIVNVLKPSGKKNYKMIAIGRSPDEVKIIQGEQEDAKERAPRIRDDLTEEGKRNAEQRKRLGQQMLQNAARKERPVPSAAHVGFGKIETLPNLPDEDKARAILTELANDPGILACMKKHKWYVRSLAELFPEGKVGESAVCVMGLNRNKGQQILLRLRTDDLKGFRKKLSIRKVLFHELAHNVHSEHDGNFFQLMRQIERECNEMDWTQGGGLSNTNLENYHGKPYNGGTFRLGGNDIAIAKSGEAERELRAQAALNRMTAEEEEIQQHCGCGGMAKFLPEGADPDVGLEGDNDTTPRRR